VKVLFILNGTAKAFMKKRGKSTVHSPQQDWQRLATVKKTAVEMKKRMFIFLIEGNKNTKFKLELTSFFGVRQSFAALGFRRRRTHCSTANCED
jgi:hypothetical protein